MSHKWNYEHPCNLWESWPFWIRWPIGIVFAIYFIGGMIAGTIGLLQLGF